MTVSPPVVCAGLSALKASRLFGILVIVIYLSFGIWNLLFNVFNRIAHPIAIHDEKHRIPMAGFLWLPFWQNRNIKNFNGTSCVDCAWPFD
jgi:hypothetical protein